MLRPLFRATLLFPLLSAAGCTGPATIRVATFNIQELSTRRLLDVDAAGAGRDTQAVAAAAIIRSIRPDILLLNEIDHDDAHRDDPARNARRFVEHYLRPGPDGIDYPYVYAAPTNTGLLSGLDLDGNGVVATAADAGQRIHGDDSFGFGVYPGQYAMALLSRYPLDTARVRTFQRFLWRDLPDHLMPADFYSDTVMRVFRLSSKSHWDVPVVVGRDTIHLLASHPTPPVFDGPEDRNGRRNHDEVGFWVRFLDDEPALYDDVGGRGGLGAGRLFVILGDLNAQPGQTESIYRGQNAIAQLLTDPRIQDTGPLLVGAGGRHGRPAGAPGFPERATATFTGGARVDYVLPGVGIEPVAGGVEWPDPEADSAAAARAALASDHRLVWLDMRVKRAGGGRSQEPR